ncbi:MAG TPA: FAD-dependent oxidoreductase [Gemmatimonadaceae bacterium]
MSERPHVVVLGGGPAGCGAAYQLRRSGKATVTLLERSAVLGGTAGSFQWGDQWLDYGSHRLHHACDPQILADIQALLGEDLRNRERHGRIRLRGQWLHFPIRAMDLLRRLDRGFALGMLRDMTIRKLIPRKEGTTFASVLLANLGPTMCHHFYFPYARKLWGQEPETLSGIQARKRVSAGSFAKLLKRLVKPPGGGRFYYMRRGYGQISEAYANAARTAGADILTGWSVTGISRLAVGERRWTVTAERETERRQFQADHIWSTIPTTLLARMAEPAPDPAVMEAVKRIDFRAMVLVYLQLDVDRFTSTDAHYFPESNVRVTRVSEPKNYFGLEEPHGTTVLCGEYPCAVDDESWRADDAALAARMTADLATAGIPLPRQPIGVLVRRLRRAYPIYLNGYEHPLAQLDDWASSQPNLLVYGRQGLFAHDNTHHALYMAYAAVDCLTNGGFDRDKWSEYRKVFATHVVED